MTVKAATVADLQRAVEEAKRLPIPVGPNLMPDGCVWPPRDGALIQALSFILDLQTQITAIPTASISPLRRVYLTKNADDPYGGDLQQAINACINPTEAAPWVVEILSPGVYTGNFVVPQHVYLTSVVPGTTLAVVLTSSSGNTLTLPETHSGLSGIAVVTESASTLDAAISIVGAAGTESTRLVLARASGLNGGASLRTQPGTGGIGPVVGIYLDCNGSSPILVDLLGAGIVVNLGGITNFSPTGTCIHASGGSAFTLIFQTVLQTQTGGTGWIVEADTGATVYVFNASTINIANGYKALTGSFVGLLNLDILLPPSGTLLELDAASFGGLGQVQIAMGANPYDLIVAPIPGNVLFPANLDYREGLLAGRPATPMPGMRYYATDQPAGARQLTYVASTGWVDQTDTIVP